MKNESAVVSYYAKALLGIATLLFPFTGQCNSGSGLLSMFESKEKPMKEVAVKIAELPEQYKITPSALDFSPDGKLLAVRSADQTINIWDWQNKRIVHTVGIAKGGNDNGTEPLRFSPDGRLLAVCHGRADGNVVIRIWRTDTWGILQDIVDPVPGGCNAIGFSADGKWLMQVLDRAPMFSQDALFVYDTSTWQKIWGLQTANFHAYTLAISPEGKSVALGGELFDGGPIKPQIAIVDLEQRAIVQTILNNGVMDRASRLAWSPDGKYLTGAGGNGLQIFEVQSGEQVVDVRPPWGTARTALRYTPDGKYLIEGTSTDRNIGWGRIWDVQHRELLQDISGNVRGIAVSRDSRYMATGTYGKTIMWQFK
ncbi:MAG: WD40 repeat domain-containing protein [Betaproteobacteria bacterium]|nr:WD40 repeat domain-containing protein [Betaproteobacteria bacterium]